MYSCCRVELVLQRSTEVIVGEVLSYPIHTHEGTHRV